MSNMPNATHLDFSAQATNEFWALHGVRDAILAMEETETWVVSGEDVDSALFMLQQKLTEINRDQLIERISTISDSVIAFMGFLNSGRALMFFRWLSEADPQMATVLVDEARHGGSDFGVLLIERLRVLERQHLLSRIFSPERFAFVLEALSDSSEVEDD